jgi:hypothetical protein
VVEVVDLTHQILELEGLAVTVAEAVVELVLMKTVLVVPSILAVEVEDLQVVEALLQLVVMAVLELLFLDIQILVQ